MSEFTYDLSNWDPSEDAAGGDFERYEGDPPKPGKYTAKLVSIKEETSKRSGNPMLTCMYIIEEPDSEFNGAPMWDRVVLVQSTEWKLAQFLTAMGVVSEDRKRGTINLESLVGTKVRLTVESGSYDGAYRPNVKRVDPIKQPVLDLGPSEPEPAEDEDVSDDPADVSPLSGDEALTELGWPTIAEVEEMTVADLKGLAEDLDIPEFAKMRKGALQTACIEALEEMLVGDPV